MESEGTTKAAIIEISSQLFREIFQIPESAEIVGIEIDLEKRGVVNVSLRGCGWDVPLGQMIPHATGTFISERDAEGRRYEPKIAWDFPLDGENKPQS